MGVAPDEGERGGALGVDLQLPARWAGERLLPRLGREGVRRYAFRGEAGHPPGRRLL